MKWFIIEGSIGSGKSTILSELSKNTNVEVISEPVDIWENLKNDDNKSLLELYYKDPSKYSYLFQTMVFMTRIRKLETPQVKNVRISERSVWTDRYVFVKTMLKQKSMSFIEGKCYDEVYPWLLEKFLPKPDGIIYLQTDPQTCYERIKHRARDCEKAISLEYLEELHKNHEEWLNNWDSCPVIIINKNNDVGTTINMINEIIK